MNGLRKMLALAAAIAVAGCAETGPAATDSDANEIADAAGVAEGGITAGAWQFAGDDRARAAAFRAPDGTLLFSIGCDVRGGLLFERHGFIARANLGMMQLRTGGAVRRLAATAGTDDRPQVQARAPYNDQLIPALIGFQEPLEVRVEGLETLILPPSPAVRKLTQSCQRDSRSTSPAAEAAPAPADEVGPR